MSGLFRRRWALAIPLTTVAAVLGANLALAGSNVHKVTASGSPYAGCTLGGPGFNSPSAEVEPFMAVNPTNHHNLIGVFQQDRWWDGGAHGLVAGVSNDGGSHWSQVSLPFSACAQGGLPFERASDPWVSIGPDGIAYANALSWNTTDTHNAVTTSRSTDGGHTWSNTLVLTDENSATISPDKNSVTADPTKPKTAYAVWDRIDFVHNNQPVYFSKTTDGGLTWSPQVAITSTADNVGTIGSIIVVDPRNGTLYDVFDNFTFSGPFVATAVESVIKSTDGGTTWSSPVAIGVDDSINPVDPVTGSVLRTGTGLPDVAIDAHNGELYVVWESSGFSSGQYNEIALSTSTDGGSTWSTPARVNKPTGLLAVTPMVAVNNDGVVGVTYYDFRTLPAANAPTSDPSTFPATYWLTTSARGAASFNKEIPIIHTPFDELSAANAFGYFLGDYQGLATDGDNFLTFFAQATGTEDRGGDPHNRSDMFFRNIEPGDQGDDPHAGGAAPNFQFHFNGTRTHHLTRLN
jgi:hypothetical protein